MNRRSSCLRASLLGFSCVFAFAAAAPAEAQSVARPGDQVRVRLADGTAFRGELLSVGGDSVRVSGDGGEPVRIGTSQIRSMDVRRPRSRESGAGRGMLMGGVALAAVGGTVFHRAGDTADDCDAASRGCSAPPGLVGALVGGALGGFVGGIWGMARPGSRWERAATPAAASARLEAAPHDGGMAVGVSVRFE